MKPPTLKTPLEWSPGTEGRELGYVNAVARKEGFRRPYWLVRIGAECRPNAGRLFMTRSEEMARLAETFRAVKRGVEARYDNAGSIPRIESIKALD